MKKNAIICHIYNQFVGYSMRSRFLQTVGSTVSKYAASNYNNVSTDKYPTFVPQLSVSGIVPPIVSKIVTVGATAGLALAVPYSSPHPVKVEVKDPNRGRMVEIPVNKEVDQVNRLLDANGISLSSELADLLILQSTIKPTRGSALDRAFENKIIEKFQKELDRGMNPREIMNEMAEDLPESIQRKILNKISEENEYNQVAVIAHTSYAMAKSFAYRLREGFTKPGRIHLERYDMSYQDTYDKDIEKYSQQIEDALIRIENTIRENKSNGKYEADALNELSHELENKDRNNYVLEEAKGFQNPTQRYREALSKEKATNSPEKNVNDESSPKNTL